MARKTPEEQYLGRGWSFPVLWQVASTEKESLPESTSKPVEAADDEESRRWRVNMSSGQQDVDEAIRIILLTTVGERLGHLRFGAGIQRYVFALRDVETAFRLEREVERALIMGEPRIRLLKVEAIPAHDADNRLDVRIDYALDTHRYPQSLIFPFYVQQTDSTS